MPVAKDSDKPKARSNAKKAGRNAAGETEVSAIRHDKAQRKNIPTAEFQPVMPKDKQNPVRVAYTKRDPDLDPQLIWRGKYDGDEELSVQAPTLYIQEKIHPKALIADLLKESAVRKQRETAPQQYGFFNDFNGIPENVDKTEFYQHDQNWTNRMILGDSLQVMASLAEREGLRSKVQMIYLDPPYGIKFNSNFQWSTTSRNVQDGNLAHVTREPEQIKAFRDTWRDGIHSYLSYLRDRFIVARDLLTESGSIFVQIGDQNVHHVREVLDEIFGANNFVSQIPFATTSGFSSSYLDSIFNHILWYAKNIDQLKYKQLYIKKEIGNNGNCKTNYQPISKIKNLKYIFINQTFCAIDNLASQGIVNQEKVFKGHNKEWYPPNNSHWKTNIDGMYRLDKASRIFYPNRKDGRILYLRMLDDFPCIMQTNLWTDTSSSFIDKVYVVQTNSKVIERCMLMSTDPGDLVLDPTCGSGTTAYVAEQWGRRWITIDTSRVALALARMRLMGAKFPYYLMADSPEGKAKEAELTRTPLDTTPATKNIALGFVYERVPHITLKSIANNEEIDSIWSTWQETLEPLRQKLNDSLGKHWEEWEIPREDEIPHEDAAKWKDQDKKTLTAWWTARIARQKDIDASIAAHAGCELLYDRPYEDKRKVRVAGPFTIESVSPHRMLALDSDDNPIDPTAQSQEELAEGCNFVNMVLENLRTSGAQQAHKEEKIEFTSLEPWPGEMICAEGRYQEGDKERRAGIFIGPEFGTVGRLDLTKAARECGDANFDILIACAFNYEAYADIDRLGRVPIVKVRMNAELHMGKALKNEGKGNLFVIFGEPDIDILSQKNAQGKEEFRVKINGVDVFVPNSGEIRSNGTEGIACWFVDTDYNYESFFVRQAYFLGANNPYGVLQRTLNAEIDEASWKSLNSDMSRPFERPKSGSIAVKVINNFGDEVMKVFDLKALKKPLK